MSEPKGATGGSTAGESSRASPKLITAGDRQLLTVELRTGETTYVSWKKLMKEASKFNGGSSASVPDPPPNANPNLESRLAPEHPVESEKADQPNRFSAVIEKIERLYMGKDSSDGEELDSSPDDDEYDTEDSFIDDAELDEYFEVDNSAVKHDGFFVNRGKLERIEPLPAPSQQPKKRQRKELGKPYDHVADVSNKRPKAGKKMAAEKIQDQSNASGQPTKKKKTNDAETANNSLSSLKAPNANASLASKDGKYTDKASHQPSNTAIHKSKEVGSSDALRQKHNNKGAHQQSNSLPGKSPHGALAEASVPKKGGNGTHDLANATGSRQPIQKTGDFSSQKKDSSNVKSKISSLEKAIRELEKVAAQSKPENQEGDTSSQAVKRRLPRDVKVKLAIVANLAARQGKISGELINRLMSIVGHLTQLRSLKRNFKIMTDMSFAVIRERDDRFQKIKKEIIEMIKSRVPLMESQATEQQAGTSDDFQDAGSKEKEPPKKKMAMDAALEDKLCDLYDTFVDGLDDDPGPQIRRLYVELAELWPKRLMDNHGIKRAICRSKERRRAKFEKFLREHSVKVKKKQSVAKSDGTPRQDTTAAVQRQQSRDKMAMDPPMSEASHDRPKQQQEKLKGSATTSSNSTEATKGIKRKCEHVREEHGSQSEKQVILGLTVQSPQLPSPPPQPQTQLQLGPVPPQKPINAGMDLNQSS